MSITETVFQGVSVCCGCPHAMAYRKRLLIADDCKFFAKVCRALLDRDFEIVGIANNGKQLLAMASFLKPDIVLADIHLPLMSGFEAGKQLKLALPSIALVLMTADACLDLGAVAAKELSSDVVFKGSSSELLAAVKKASDCNFLFRDPVSTNNLIVTQPR